MSPSLERRFLDFLASLPGSESLDFPGVFPVGYKGKKGDFALFQRSLIVEVKCLQDDPSTRVQGIVDSYQSEPGFPLFYGKRPLTQVVNKMPPAMREEVRERVAMGVTTALENAVKDANRQVRETKKVLGLRDSGGLLIVLNDDIPILSPNLITYRIQKAMKKKRHGKPRFAELDWVLAVLYRHLLKAQDGTWAYPFLMLQGAPSATLDRVDSFAEYIRYQWGVWEGTRMLVAKGNKELLEDYRIIP